MTDFEKDLLEVFDFALDEIEAAEMAGGLIAGSIYTASEAISLHDDAMSAGLTLSENALRDNCKRLNVLYQCLRKASRGYREAFERMDAKREAAEHEE